MLKGSAFGALDCIDGMHDDDEAHAQLVQQDRVEVCAEAAPPAVVTPLASWLDLGRMVAEGVADEELARHDGMERAVELAGVVGVVQRNQSSSAIALWSFVGVSARGNVPGVMEVLVHFDRALDWGFAIWILAKIDPIKAFRTAHGSEWGGECRASKRTEHLADSIMHWSQCYYDFLECKTMRHDQVAPEQECDCNLLHRLCTGTHKDRQGIGFQ
jgi:hypothetical protein